MNEIFSRTDMLIGSSSLRKLNNSHIALFGVGGVGGFVAEALARSGVGKIDLIDNDTVSPSNINRQILALHSTIGKDKVSVAADRLKDINPEIQVREIKKFILPENIDELDFSGYDYVIDAIDTVSGKLAIIEKAYNCKIPVISSMGTGNKLDPSAFRITDISKTTVCPLARVMRYELKKRGIKKLKVLFSAEEPIKRSVEQGIRPTPASIAFVPSVAGLLIAGEVIRDLIKDIE